MDLRQCPRLAVEPHVVQPPVERIRPQRRPVVVPPTPTSLASVATAPAAVLSDATNAPFLYSCSVAPFFTAATCVHTPAVSVVVTVPPAPKYSVAPLWPRNQLLLIPVPNCGPQSLATPSTAPSDSPTP